MYHCICFGLFAFSSSLSSSLFRPLRLPAQARCAQGGGGAWCARARVVVQGAAGRPMRLASALVHEPLGGAVVHARRGRAGAVDPTTEELGPPALACVRGGPICSRRREEGSSGGAMVMGAGEGRTEIRMPVVGRRLRSSARRMRSCALACQPSQLLACHAVTEDARPPLGRRW